MHELLGRVLEQFINRQIAIPNWFTGGRTVMLNKDGEESAANKRPITCLNTMYKLFTKIIGTFLINHNMKYDLIQLDQRGAQGDNSHRLGYGMCHFFRVLFWLKNKFLGLFYSF